MKWSRRTRLIDSLVDFYRAASLSLKTKKRRNLAEVARVCTLALSAPLSHDDVLESFHEEFEAPDPVEEPDPAEIRRTVLPTAKSAAVCPISNKSSEPKKAKAPKK